MFAGAELGSIYASSYARLLLQPLLGNDAEEMRVDVGIWLAVSLFWGEEAAFYVALTISSVFVLSCLFLEREKSLFGKVFLQYHYKEAVRLFVVVREEVFIFLNERGQEGVIFLHGVFARQFGSIPATAKILNKRDGI